VGAAALEGLEGVKRIDKGFHNFKEINTVYYDASIITVEEIADALKKAGTYQGTVKQDGI
jgi:copper chaperone CopZ